MRTRCKHCKRAIRATSEDWGECGPECPALRSVADRFWDKVAIGPDCWEWMGGRGAKHRGGPGYGMFTIHHGDQHQATHVAWALSRGDWPQGQIMHLCDNPPCVRPSHLRDGTPKENTQDMIAKGRAGWITHPDTFKQLAADMRQKYAAERANATS